MIQARAFWLTGKGRGALKRESLPDPAGPGQARRAGHVLGDQPGHGTPRGGRKSPRRSPAGDALPLHGRRVPVPRQVWIFARGRSRPGAGRSVRPEGPRAPSPPGPVRRPVRGRPTHPQRPAPAPPWRATWRRRSRRSGIPGRRWESAFSSLASASSDRSLPGSSPWGRRSTSRSPRRARTPPTGQADGIPDVPPPPTRSPSMSPSIRADLRPAFRRLSTPSGPRAGSSP